jgi:uracil-DNA glycosylase
MRRPLLLGEAPSRNGDPTLPLSGRSGRRLCELSWIDPDDYATLARTYELKNLVSSHQEKAKGKKGDQYDMPRAIINARSMLAAGEFEDRIVILLGKRVAMAVLERYDLPDWYVEIQHHRFGKISRVVIVPHPSGVSRHWNDRQNVCRAYRFWGHLKASTDKMTANAITGKLA